MHYTHHKGIQGSGGIVSLILNLCTAWQWCVCNLQLILHIWRYYL